MLTNTTARGFYQEKQRQARSPEALTDSKGLQEPVFPFRKALAALVATVAFITTVALSGPGVSDAGPVENNQETHLIVDWPPPGEPQEESEKPLGGAPSEPLMVE